MPYSNPMDDFNHGLFGASSHELDLLTGFPIDDCWLAGDDLSPFAAHPVMKKDVSCVAGDISSDAIDLEMSKRFDKMVKEEEAPAAGIFLDASFDYGAGSTKINHWGPYHSVSSYGLLTPADEDKTFAFGLDANTYSVNLNDEFANYHFGLPSAVDERSMSFSSVSSSHFASDSDSASPLMAPRHPDTPPPSPCSPLTPASPVHQYDLAAAYDGATYKASPKTTNLAKTVPGVPADQFFVMENAFTPTRPHALQTLFPMSHGSPYAFNTFSTPTPPMSPVPLTITPSATFPAPAPAKDEPASADDCSSPTESEFSDETVKVKLEKEDDDASVVDEESEEQDVKDAEEDVKAPLAKRILGVAIAPVRSSTHRSSTSSPHPKPFHCELCPASFSRKHDLKRHTRIHLGIRPFKCDCCAKVFSRHDALSRHLIKWGCDKKLEAMAAQAAAVHSHAHLSNYVMSPEAYGPGEAFGLGMSF
ncbi:hypothetical protein PhCBS80983_g03432 [Powellomyces hirtus]|uniref:C2H2-type domain-containing protein n=1 Tax=Powellomyces hirtus TaxID=109895 RepID=A0A507E3Z6_9FUNG|nr:hypothetical protein PhCBS80983_g03432 [Powellomyces hirtus]